MWQTIKHFRKVSQKSSWCSQCQGFYGLCYSFSIITSKQCFMLKYSRNPSWYFWSNHWVDHACNAQKFQISFVKFFYINNLIFCFWTFLSIGLLSTYFSLCEKIPLFVTLPKYTLYSFTNLFIYGFTLYCLASILLEYHLAEMILINLNFFWFYFRINQVKGEIICETNVPCVTFIVL